MKLDPHIKNLFTHKFGASEYFLIYIGIGPRNEKNKSQFIKERIIDYHLGNKITNSTLRFSIASRLRKPAYAERKETLTKYFLHHNGEDELNEFLKNEFCIGICKNHTPWEIEPRLINDLQPPLNLQHNTLGWHYTEMKKIRASFQMLAKNSKLSQSL